MALTVKIVLCRLYTFGLFQILQHFITKTCLYNFDRLKPVIKLVMVSLIICSSFGVIDRICSVIVVLPGIILYYFDLFSLSISPLFMHVTDRDIRRFKNSLQPCLIHSFQKAVIVGMLFVNILTFILFT